MTNDLSSDLASLRIDRGAVPPPRGGGIFVVLAAIAALSGATFLAYRKYAPTVFKVEIATTEVTLVSPTQAATELTAVGYVIAQRQSKIACQVLTRVSQMLVREGDHVKAGDVLFKVEDAAQRAAESAARARALAARARIATEQAKYAEVKQQLARETRLVQSSVAPPATAEDRREQLNAQEAAIKAAEEDAAAAEEEVRAAAVQLEYTVVRAPFAGVVIGKPLDVGEMVGTFTEKPAVELCDPATLLAEIDVPEKRLGMIKIGGPAEIVLEAYPENRYRGVVHEVGSKVDRAKGTIVVKLEFLDRPERLLPDMRCRASFLTEKLDDALAKEPPKTIVPRAAVAERAGDQVVFLVDDGRARMLRVTLGPAFAGGYELRGGPPPGTVLVADPPPTLADGQPVKEKSRD